ncbi:MAG TPA: DUF979 domain-containing protein [Aliidongia sp.]|nr:DUF979 domain-containing protein [Aliidongia sp.]
MLISIDAIYVVVGLFLGIITLLTAVDMTNPRRLTTALFWGLFAFTFLFGGLVPSWIVGAMLVAMALIAGLGGVRHGIHPIAPEAERHAHARRLGHWVFVPALTIPAVTVIATLFLKDWKIFGLALLDPTNVTLAAYGAACIIAFLVVMAVTRSGPVQPLRGARRLLDSIGWAAVLPQSLAMLGAVFAAAGVGKVVADLVGGVIPADSRFLVVAAYAIGMALFTMVMGNAFAAFPVMTAGIGVPLIVHQHGGDAAAMAAIGMFSGYCGTLMTPMAANFNIVPAALLDLPDQNAVIKAQIPTAIPLLAVNVLLMYWLVFR